uniref:Uncharacterized protein n=1 Tax=Nelumbo nucifera TaxID=4432 RepID=A0A822ZJH6_NELNU|nr:TPA_asm: hypothetical protein HUJ06_003043 [Nelumbo nucifera]
MAFSQSEKINYDTGALGFQITYKPADVATILIIIKNEYLRLQTIITIITHYSSRADTNLFQQREGFISNYSGDRQDPETKDLVTTCLYLKPSRTSKALDKYEVLRRIRHFRERSTSSLKLAPSGMDG